MSSPKLAINRPAIVTKAVLEIFETMVCLPAATGESGNLPPAGDQILGTVGLASDSVAGSVHLHCSTNLAGEITRSMLGAPPQPVAVNDAIGELTNMIAGALKSAYCDAGHICVMSIPGIVRGTALTVRNLASTSRERFFFTCTSEVFIVEVHTQISQQQKD